MYSKISARSEILKAICIAKQIIGVGMLCWVNEGLKSQVGLPFNDHQKPWCFE